MRRSTPALFLSLAALACAPDNGAPPMPLPDLVTLPHGINEDCGCVEDGQCVALEERLGEFEIRNLDCRWREANVVAECRYEKRFIAHYFRSGSAEPAKESEPWQRHWLLARRTRHGGWCAMGGGV